MVDHTAAEAPLLLLSVAGPAFAGLGQHAARLHGGPPLVYVDYHKYLTSLNSPWIQAATVHQGPHYLGVGHYWLPVGGGDGRTYHHYLIKMEAAPPFRILQVRSKGLCMHVHCCWHLLPALLHDQEYAFTTAV